MDSPYPIRSAETEDAARLASIDKLASTFPWNHSQFESSLTQDSDRVGREQLLVADKQGQAVAFIVFSAVFDEMTIENLAVHPDFQRQGLARQLIEKANAVAETQGAKRCLLEVRQSNQAAKALYESLGFAVDGIRKNYYPAETGREDAVLMSRAISA